MERKNRRARAPSIERLEQRAFLAGNVTASVTNGDLMLRGDDRGNSFALYSTGPSSVRVMHWGMGDTTTINGVGFVDFNGVTRDIRIDLRGGDDVARVGLAFPGLTVGRDVRVQGGEGRDMIFLNTARVAGNVNIDGGNGNDDVGLSQSEVGGGLTLTGGAGTEFYTLNDTRIGRAANINLGAEADTFNFDSTEFVASLTVDGGEGNNHFLTTRSNIRGALSLRCRGGLDTWDFQEFVVGSNVTVDLGAGDDRVASHDASTFRGNVNLMMGGGNDTVQLLRIEAGGNVALNLGGGDDTVVMSQGNLAKSLNIQAGEGRNIVMLDNTTRVQSTLVMNGGGGFDLLSLNLSEVGQTVTFNGNGGDDEFRIHQSTLYAAVFNGGIGNDRLNTSGNWRSGALNVNGAGGVDVVTLEGAGQCNRNASILLGAGDDVMSVSLPVFLAPLSIDLGGGNDNLNLRAFTMESTVSVNAGQGDDVVYLGNPPMIHAFPPEFRLTSTMNMGPGNDQMNIWNVWFRGAFRYQGMAGNDAVLCQYSRFDVNATVDGGAGTDALDAGVAMTIDRHNTGPLPILISIEQLLS